MKCRKPEISERLLFYVEDVLMNESERTQIEEHLKKCDACREACDRYRKAIDLLIKHKEHLANGVEENIEIPPFQMTAALQAYIRGSWAHRLWYRLSNEIKTIGRVVWRPVWGVSAIALVVILIGAYGIAANSHGVYDKLAPPMRAGGIDLIGNGFQITVQ